MQRKSPTVLIVIFIIIGISGLLRFSHNVRSVDVVGLFASGFACGVALMGIITYFRNKTKVDQLK